MANCFKCGREVFRYVVANGKDLCRECAAVQVTRRVNLYPFTQSHTTGKPLTISSFKERERVERDYGVVFPAFHVDEKNLSPERVGEIYDRKRQQRFDELRRGFDEARKEMSGTFAGRAFDPEKFVRGKS